MTDRARAFLPVLLIALAAPALAAGKVWVVDSAGGPGSYSIAIQPAVDAAADGDAILVRSGTYAPFTIAGKGLHVASDSSAQIGILGQITVRDLSAQQSVALRGFRILTPIAEGLVARDNLGPVWLEYCDLTGSSGSLPHEDGQPGIRIEQCATVVLERCVLTGGNGVPSLQFSNGSGASGLVALGSSVSLHDCVLAGGNGGYAGETFGGGAGDGADLTSSALFCTGSMLTGGNGGYGGEDCFFFGGCQCYSGGWGGHGIRAAAGSQVTVLDCELAPGAPGGSECAGPGQPGELLVLSGGSTHIFVPALHRSFQLSSPEHEGTATMARLTGLPGDIAVIAIAPQPALLALPPMGTLVLASPYHTVFAGVLPPSGVLQVPLALPLLGAGVESRAFFGQAGFLGALGDGIVLGGGSALLVLDQAF